MILLEGYGIIQIFKIPFSISLAPLAVGSGEGFSFLSDVDVEVLQIALQLVRLAVANLTRIKAGPTIGTNTIIHPQPSSPGTSGSDIQWLITPFSIWINSFLVSS